MHEIDLISYEFLTGAHAGEQLAKLLISGEFPYWHSYLKQLNAMKLKGQKNKLHLALEYQINLLLRAKPKLICPQCGTRPVALVALRDNGGWFNSMRLKDLCCQSEKCKHSAEFHTNSHLVYKLNFELYYVKSKLGKKLPIDPVEVTELLQRVFELPAARPTDNEVIECLRKFAKSARVRLPKAS